MSLKAQLEQRRRKWASRGGSAIEADRRLIFEHLKSLPVRIDREQFERFVNSLTEAYVRRFPPHEIVKHYLSFRHHQQGQTTTILAPAENGWNLTILTSDHPFLLAQIAGTLALNQLNILEAEAFTHPDGIVLDHFLVQDPVGYLRDETRRKTFQAALEREMASGDLDSKIEHKTHTFSLPSEEIHLAIEKAPEYSAAILELECPDRIGLLYRVATAISQQRCDIQSAYIETAQDRAHDMFLVTCNGGIPSEDVSTGLVEHLKQALTE